MASWQHFVTAAATTAALTLSSGALADKGGDGDYSGKDCKGGHEYRADGKNAEKRLKRLAKKLDLTDEQQAQIKTRMESNRSVASARRDEIHNLRSQLQQAARDNASDGEINALADKLGNLIAEGAVAKVQREKYMNEVLTDEQQQEYQKIKEKMRQRHEKKSRKKD